MKWGMPTIKRKLATVEFLLLAAILVLLSPNKIFAATTVVTSEQMQGWIFINDQTSGAGTGSMVSGPCTPPLGKGSAQLVVTSTSAGQTLMLPGYLGAKLSDITSLTYFTYQDPVNSSNAAAIHLQFNVDKNVTDADNSWQGRIVYEPYYNNGGTVPLGAWTEWNALNSGDSRWWFSRSATKFDNNCPDGAPCTLAEIITLYPNIGIHPTLGAVVLKAGSGWAAFTGEVDALTIGVSGTISTYDFDMPSTTSDICIAPPASSSGGGGGSALPLPNLRVSGKAYPGAQIILVEKSLRGDTLIRQEVPVSANGDFEIVNPGILFDQYTYSLIVKDKEGRQTQTKVYNIDFVNNIWVVIKDFLVSPTISLARSIVTKGDFIKVVGYASVNNKIKIELDNDAIYETSANEKGEYQLLINTASLPLGSHTIRANQTDLAVNKESDFSLTAGFLVSNSTVPQADFNNDGKVDIKDWSIFLARWTQGGEADKKLMDLNSDAKLDISDLGIFLRSLRTL